MDDYLVTLFKLFNMAAAALTKALEARGMTLDQLRESVDAEENAFFDENQRRIDELKAKQS
jgi:hypothetical protein